MPPGEVAKNNYTDKGSLLLSKERFFSLAIPAVIYHSLFTAAFTRPTYLYLPT